MDDHRPHVRPGAHTALGGRERRSKPPAWHLVAVLLAAEALLAAGFALWPPTPSHRALNAMIAALLALAAVGCTITWNRRGRLWLLQTWLVLAWGMPMIMIATRTLEASQLLWSVVVLVVTVIVAYYLPRRLVVYQVVAVVSVYLVVTAGLGGPTRALFALGFVALLALTTVAVAWVRADRDRLVEAIVGLATTDPLTGLLNRRGLELEADIVHANATVPAARRSWPCWTSTASRRSTTPTDTTPVTNSSWELPHTGRPHCVKAI